jgi:hypothetical protein
MSNNISVVPQSLVMRCLKCDYCDKTTDISETIIMYAYGIYHCDEHTENAERDCIQFMREKGIVQFSRIPSGSNLKFLINYLSNKTFGVIRSNQKFEEGWYISKVEELESLVQMLKYLPEKHQLYPWFINVSNGEYTKWTTLYSIIEYLENYGDKNIMNYYKQSLDELNSMIEIVNIS